MNRGQLEQRLLVLITLGLVAFGLVMVYSATSAAAALGNGDPVTFLKRQGIRTRLRRSPFFSRFDHAAAAPRAAARALRAPASPSRCSCSRRRSRRTALLIGGADLPRRSCEVALLIWAAAYLAVTERRGLSPPLKRSDADLLFAR